MKAKPSPKMRPTHGAASSWVEVGKVLREWGVHGMLKCLCFNPASPLFAQRQSFYLLPPEKNAIPTLFEVEWVQPHGAPAGEYWRLKFKGVESPEVAKAFRGHLLLVPRDELPPLKPGEVYLNDLLGLEVHSPQAQVLGQVLALQALGGSEGLVIGQALQQSVPIPYEDEFVAAIDWEARTLKLTELGHELIKINEV